MNIVTTECIKHKMLAESIMERRDATVAGWGFTSFPMGEPSPKLQKLQVTTISNKECASLIEETVSPGMLCASSEQLQGTCFVRISVFYIF